MVTPNSEIEYLLDKGDPDIQFPSRAYVKRLVQKHGIVPFSERDLPPLPWTSTIRREGRHTAMLLLENGYEIHVRMYDESITVDGGSNLPPDVPPAPYAER